MQRQCFDAQWRFKFDAPEGWWVHTPNVATWRVLDLPHDWSIELDRDPTNPSGASGGYFTMGRGQYHKTFSVPKTWRDKKVYIEFEGVYMNAEIRLNQHFLDRHPYGYTSFMLDLTPYLNFGADDNILTVTVDNTSQLNSRWYSGSGIYRHVWLLVTDPLHIAHWGVNVTTPSVTSESATAHVGTTVENASDTACEVTVYTRVLGPDGNVVGTAEMATLVEANSRHEVTQEIRVSTPRLWSPDTPYLYQVESEIIKDGTVVDTSTTPFGIRTLHFDAEQGFLLNGQAIHLKGGCVHHDNGVLGAASYDRAEERKVEMLKASGFNAVRCAHNPPAPAFLDACDRLGMLVIDEAFDCWRDGKNPHDYHVAFDAWWRRDLASMLTRDRNHPSIIMWSIGNEVRERAGDSDGKAIAQMLTDYVHAIDPTRPVTAAINGSGGSWPWSRTDDVFAVLDVGGYNYQQQQYVPDHEKHPQRVMYGSESTAGEAFEHWMDVLDHNYVIGDFVWTALDYLGEAGIGRVHFEETTRTFLGAYPWHQANCGDLDLCYFKRPQSYYRDILWERGAPLYIAVHPPIPEGKTPNLTYWGWPDVWPNWTRPGKEGELFKVDVYSACEEVELFLNGESQGVKPTTKQEKFIATFEVPYVPGSLKAVGYQNNEARSTCTIETVDEPTRIQLTADRNVITAKAGDLCFVTAEVVDQDGHCHPNADHNILFTTSGVGAIVAVGNANPVSTESYRGNQRRAFRGRCLVVVKSSGKAGEIHLRAQADGLDSAEILIDVA